jgi:hypothetical protein
MDCDNIVGFFEEHAVIADAQPGKPSNSPDNALTRPAPVSA